MRNSDGTVLMNQASEFQISILEDAINGEMIYQETHLVTSNNFGLVDFVIGQGEVIEGSFSSISWGDHSYFVEVGLDIGQGLEIMGTQQLMSVPYALHSETATLALNAPAGPQGEQGIPGVNGIDGADGVDGVTILTGSGFPSGDLGNPGDMYVDNTNGAYYINNEGTWEEQGSIVGPQGIQGEPGPQGPQGIQGLPGQDGEDGEQGEIGPIGLQGDPGPQGVQGLMGMVDGPCEILPTNSGKIVVYTPEFVYGYGQNSFPSYDWSTRTLVGELQGAVASDSTVVVYTDTRLYGFGQNSFPSATWFERDLASPVLATVVTGGAIAMITAGKLYGFGTNSSGTTTWVEVDLDSEALGWNRAGRTIVVFTAGKAYGFGPNSFGSYGWSVVDISGSPAEVIGTK